MSNIQKWELKLLSGYMVCIGWGITPILNIYFVFGQLYLIKMIMSYGICDIMCSLISSIPIWFLPYKDKKTRILRQILVVLLYATIIATAWFVVFEI